MTRRDDAAVASHADALAAYVDGLKQQLREALASAGAVHFQIGKFYPYAERLEPNTLALVQAMKQALDPQRRMNPGVLGL